jgi:Protein of unknown function (DUF4231)
MATREALPGGSEFRMFWRRVFFLLTRAERAEVGALSAHVLRVLENEAVQEPRGDTEHLRDWVTYRFAVPLEENLREASFNARVRTVINLVVIAGGFATSGIAVAAGSGEPGSALSWIVFAIGLLVALAGGISQTFRPGQRASARKAFGEQLRREGWALVNEHGDYQTAKRDPQQSRFELFDQRVSEIHLKATELVGVEGPEAGGATE